MPISRNSLTECWVGLVFSSPAERDVGQQCQVNKTGILARKLHRHLPDCFQKRERFDIANRAADLDDGYLGSRPPPP